MKLFFSKLKETENMAVDYCGNMVITMAAELTKKVAE